MVEGKGELVIQDGKLRHRLRDLLVLVERWVGWGARREGRGGARRGKGGSGWRGARLRASIGIGVRIRVPFLPSASLEFSLAYPSLYQSTDDLLYFLFQLSTIETVA